VIRDRSDHRIFAASALGASHRVRARRSPSSSFTPWGSTRLAGPALPIAGCRSRSGSLSS